MYKDYVYQDEYRGCEMFKESIRLMLGSQWQVSQVWEPTGATEAHRYTFSVK